MKLSLSIRSHPRGFFHPGDIIQGSLAIRNAKSPPQVTICLAGQLTTQVPVQGLGANPGTQTETIFQLKKNLDPAALSCSVDDDGKPIYTCAVEMQLPSNADAGPDEPSAAGQLPSSLNIAASDFSVRVEYFVTATARRYIFGGVPTNSTARRDLQVVSNPAPSTSLSPLDTPSSPEARNGRIRYRNDGVEKIPSLPLYSEIDSKARPYVQLQLLLPQPAVLVRGQTCPIELVARAAAHSISTNKALIQSIVINLLQTVSVRLGNTTRKTVRCLHSISITGAISVSEEDFAMHLGASGILSLYNAYPTCNSGAITIDHSVEAEVTVSQANKPGLQTLKLRNDVMVMDPPPVYDTGNN